MLVRLSRGFGAVYVNSSRYTDNVGKRGVWSGSCIWIVVVGVQHFAWEYRNVIA